MKRKCSMCGEYKEEAEFPFKKRKGKLYCYCKNCQRLYTKEYMRIYRERQKEQQEDLLRKYEEELAKNRDIKIQMAKMNITIETLLAEFERLEDIEDKFEAEKEKNKELEKYEEYYKDMEEVNKKFIPADKIKAKIEELDKNKKKSQFEYSTVDELIFDKKIEVLQELLEEE